MPRRPDSSTQLDDERKYDDAVVRRDKDDQKQQAHDAKKQSKSLPHASEIREAQQHEAELRDKFFHTDYSARTGLSPADRLAKMSHDATLVTEERAKAAKLIEQDESAEFWEHEHAIQAAHSGASPKAHKKTISAKHDEVVPSSKISHSTAKPNEPGVLETAIDVTEQVPQGQKQKQWEEQNVEAAPESLKTTGEISTAAVLQGSVPPQPIEEPKQKQQLWSFTKTNAGSLEQHDEDHPSEGKIGKLDRAAWKPADEGVQEKPIDAKEQVPRGRKQKKWDEEPRDKLEAWPQQDGKIMRHAMQEAQARMRESGDMSHVALQQRLVAAKQSLDKTKAYREQKVIPNVEEWHADPDNHPSTRDRETFREQVEHVTDSILHPFSHKDTDETVVSRPLAQPTGQKISGQSHSMSKPDEVGVQEDAIDAKEQVPLGRKQKKWETKNVDAAPKSVKSNEWAAAPISQKRSAVNTDGPGAPIPKEREIEVDASPSGVWLGGQQHPANLIDRIEYKIDTWRDEAGSKLSDLKQRIQGDAEVAKDKGAELKDRAEDKASDLKDRFDARKDSWSSDLKRKEARLESKAREVKSDVVEDANALGAKIGAIKDKAVSKVEEIGAEVKKEVGDLGSEIKKGTSSVLDKFSNQPGDDMDPIVEIQREREMEKFRGLDSAGRWTPKVSFDRDNKSHEPSGGLLSRFRGWLSPKSRSAQVQQEAERSARDEAVHDGSKPDWPDARRTTQWERDNAINHSLLDPERMQAKLDELRTTEQRSAPAAAGGPDSQWTQKHTFAGDIRSSLSGAWSNLKNKTGEPAEEALPDDTRAWSAAPLSSASLQKEQSVSLETKFERHFTSMPHPSSFSPSLSDVTPSTGPSIISYRPAKQTQSVRAYSDKAAVLSDQPRYLQPVDFDAIAFDAAIEPW